MEVVAQLVRASDCGSEGRGFETRLPPQTKKPVFYWLFCFIILPRFYNIAPRAMEAALFASMDAALRKHDQRH